MLKDHGYFRRKGIKDYISSFSQKREKPIYDSTVTAILSDCGIDVPSDPASLYDPEQTFLALKRFCENTQFKKDSFICAGINLAYKTFAKKNEYLTPILEEDELYSVIKTKKSAGIYFTNKMEAWDEAWKRQSEIYNRMKAPNPCVAFARTQRGGKTRLVWGYPLDMTMIEAKYAVPLIKKFKRIDTPICYGKYRFHLGMQLNYQLDGRNVVSLDYSKFDSTVPAELILVAFNILWTWFDQISVREIEIIEDYFINTPIVMSDGHLYSGKNHGIPSGSMFTNLVGSIVNFILLTALSERLNFHFTAERGFVLGDDSIFSTNSDVNIYQISQIMKEYGMNINTTKSEVRRRDQPYHFLGFYWDKGLPRREETLLVSSMTQPEKWRAREKQRENEKIRALKLIYSMCSIGFEGYNIMRRVFNTHPYALLHVFTNMCSKDDFDDDVDYGSDYLNFLWSQEGVGLDWPSLPTLLLC